MVKYNSESDFLQDDTHKNGLFGGDGADRFHNENDIANQNPQNILKTDLDDNHSNGLFGGDGADVITHSSTNGIYGGSPEDVSFIPNDIANQSPQNVRNETEGYKSLYVDEVGDQTVDFTQLSKYEVDHGHDLEEVSFHYEEGSKADYVHVLDVSDDSVEEWSLGIDSGDFI